MSLRPKTQLIRIKYDETSKGYDELYSAEQIEKYEAVSSIIAVAKGLLCDAGAGTLLLAEYMKEKGLDNNYSYIVAFDVSQGMLEKARARARRLGVEAKVELLVGDIENIPLRSNVCSLLTSFTVIDLTDNPRQALNEMERVSKLLIVSLLKKAQSMKTANLRPGRKIAETSKDIIFVRTG